jgi:hypothetical protein
MDKNLLIYQIVEFHFFDIPLQILKVWKNYLRFFANYFSIPLLLKTLFSPWRKIYWEYPRGFQIGLIFEILIGNLFSRLIGFLMRSVLIIVGCLFEILTFFLGIFFLFLWYFLPLIFVYLIFFF